MRKIPSILFFYLITYGQIELPEYSTDEIIIENTGYTVSFNEAHLQPNWVAYELTKSEALGSLPRKNNFQVDPQIHDKTALPTDFKGTNFDRGHLAPAADMAWSKAAMEESFYMSNISPQHYSFNRGIWKKLENLVRKWAIEYGSVYIVTAGVLDEGLNQTGNRKNISIPENYFKVILDYQEPGLKAIGFLLPNKKINQSLMDYVFTVDDIERITGINFFHILQDDIEERLESKTNPEMWIWE